MRNAWDLLTLLAVVCILFAAATYQVARQHEIIAKLQHDNRKQSTTLAVCQSQVERQADLLHKAFGEPVGQRPLLTKKVIATAYTARAEECDGTPWFTASMTLSRVGVLAVSRDLEALGLTLGKTVIIKGMGLFRIEDRMNARWFNRVDILHANVEAARRFAKQDIEILWIGEG